MPLTKSTVVICESRCRLLFELHRSTAPIECRSGTVECALTDPRHTQRGVACSPRALGQRKGIARCAKKKMLQSERAFLFFCSQRVLARTVFKSNSTYKYFHTKYTSREAHINRWKVACAVAAATGSAGSVPEEPANLPTQLDVPINHAKNFLLPIS